MDIFSIIQPIDLIIGGSSFLVGIFVKKNKYKNNPLFGFTIFMQVSLIMIKMAKYYYDTHPEARKHCNPRYLRKLTDIYLTKLQKYDKPRLYHDNQTGAIG